MLSRSSLYFVLNNIHLFITLLIFLLTLLVWHCWNAIHSPPESSKAGSVDLIKISLRHWFNYDTHINSTVSGYYQCCFNSPSHKNTHTQKGMRHKNTHSYQESYLQSSRMTKTVFLPFSFTRTTYSHPEWQKEYFFHSASQELMPKKSRYFIVWLSPFFSPKWERKKKKKKRKCPNFDEL